MSFTQLSANHFEPIKKSELKPVNPHFQAIKAALSNNKCYNMQVSSMSLINRNGNKVSTFTTYGSAHLSKEGNKLVSLGDIRTSLSDRNHFQGKKALEKVYIMESGNNIVVKILLKTWGNDKISLKDVKISKEENGYFITGKATSPDNNRRQVYYTIALFEEGCLH